MKRFTLMIVGVLLSCPAGAAADKEWSSWQATDDPLIQWRLHIETYGKYISPDCVFQFQRTDDSEASFNYLVSYMAPSGSTGQRKGSAYGITSSEHGGNVISGCRGITHIAVSAVRAKTVRRSGLVFSTCDPGPDALVESCNKQKLECNNNRYAWCETKFGKEGTDKNRANRSAYQSCVDEGLARCGNSRAKCLSKIHRCPSGQFCDPRVYACVETQHP